MALGHEDVKHKYTPKPIKAFKNIKIKQITTGRHFAMALGENGLLYVWGRGEFGTMGFENKP